MTIRVCLAGATGWAGSALALATIKTSDIRIVSTISRTYAGQKLGEVLHEAQLECPVYATAEEALVRPCDVFFEYTKPDVAKSNVIAALQHGAHVVIGTSGLTDDDYAEIAATAEQRQRGVLAVGNFAITVVLLQKFAQIAARHIPQWEIIDYASDRKKDAPSGTARELVHRLSAIRPSELGVRLEETQGEVATRGARMNGSQVHSIRLPSFSISAEVIFAMPDQRLSIRHDSGSSAQPYIEGAMLAIRKVSSFTGLRRGLDSVLDL
jgi:4-hydroxy-tetrahydrodipicolinate reductase